MNNVCDLFQKQKIYKILHHKSSQITDIDKYIFVGPQPDDIKKILRILEKKGTLGSSDKKRLNNKIPYYEKIIGNILVNHTFFIYHYIDDNTNIEHLQENICVLINNKRNITIKTDKEKLLPSVQYLWYVAKNINLPYYIDLINQLFIKTDVLSPIVFFEKLENILMMNKKEIGTLIMQLNPKKYKSVDDITCLQKTSYEYEYVYENDDLRSLMNTSNVALSNQNNIIVENNILSFVKYINPLIVLKKKI